VDTDRKDNLLISPSPHMFSKVGVKETMWNVVIALLPAVGVSIWLFRAKALMLILVCISVSIISEWIFLKLRKRVTSITDGSAVVTGLLVALILPPNIPLGIAALGAAVSIIIGKQVFGGLGHNIFNPVLVGRAFLMATFPVVMTSWITPFTLNAVTSATPLGLFKFSSQTTHIWDLFLGTVSGSLGETSALALIIGGLYLIFKGYADWRIPMSIFLTVVILSSVLYIINSDFGSPLFHLFSGGLMIGALFMATDPVTSPITLKGKWIFGVGIGLIVIIIRIWGGLPEGVMYSILLMNAFTPLVNRMSKPRRFGT